MGEIPSGRYPFKRAEWPASVFIFSHSNKSWPSSRPALTPSRRSKSSLSSCFLFPPAASPGMSVPPALVSGQAVRNQRFLATSFVAWSVEMSKKYIWSVDATHELRNINTWIQDSHMPVHVTRFKKIQISNCATHIFLFALLSPTQYWELKCLTECKYLTARSLFGE